MPPIIKLIYDDEILLIHDPICSKQQMHTEEEPMMQKNNIRSFVRRCISFLESYLNFSLISSPLPRYPSACGLCEGCLSHPKVFVLHQIGQPLLTGWKEQVPSNTLLIAIAPGDWPAHNCFLAQPIPLEHLRKELQPDESMRNMPSYAFQGDDAQCPQK